MWPMTAASGGVFHRFVQDRPALLGKTRRTRENPAWTRSREQPPRVHESTAFFGIPAGFFPGMTRPDAPNPFMLGRCSGGTICPTIN